MTNVSNEETANAIKQFGQLQQQYQSIVFQKETIALQLQELEAAIKELDSAKGDVYRATGMILVKKDASSVKAEISEQKELLNVRLSAIAKQEKAVSERLVDMQKKLMQSQAFSGGAAKSAAEQKHKTGANNAE